MLPQVALSKPLDRRSAGCYTNGFRTNESPSLRDLTDSHNESFTPVVFSKLKELVVQNPNGTEKHTKFRSDFFRGNFWKRRVEKSCNPEGFV